jgi:DNA modification methylase
MTPYYRQHGITLYHGDALDVLPDVMSGIQLLLTDPPYGTNLSLHSTTRRRSMKPIAGDKDQEAGVAVLKMLAHLPQIVFAKPKLPWPGKWDQWLVWDKGPAVGGGGDIERYWKLTWELIQTRNLGKLTGKRDAAVISQWLAPTDSPLHICQKPIGLVKYLLHKTRFVSVIDPFCGSGTTLLAAKELGLQAVGIEVDEQHCETTAKRNSMKIEEANITPKMAQEWLAKANNDNRQLRAGVAEAYASDMRLGRWRMTHQAIAFDKDGNLIDGQHRLWAIVEYGKPVKMMVAHGVDPESRVVVDTGLNRKGTDALHFHGVTGERAIYAASLRRIWMGDSSSSQSGKLTNSGYVELHLQHETAVRWALERVATRHGIRQASVIAAIARAYYHVRREDLERFCKILSSGVITDTTREHVILLLREWLIARKYSYGGNGQVDVYLKTQRAIQAFIECETLSTLYAARKDLFPLKKKSA